MTLSLVNSVATSANGTTTFTVNKPASSQNKDVLIGAIAAANFAITAPAGWTAVLSNLPMVLAYRIIDGSEGASFNWTSGSIQNWAGGIACFRGVDGGVAVASQQNGTNTTAAFSAVSASFAALVLAAVGENSSPTASISWPPAGYTSVFNQTNGGDMAATLAYKFNVTGLETPGSVSVDAGVFSWRSITAYLPRLQNRQASVI